MKLRYVFYVTLIATLLAVSARADGNDPREVRLFRADQLNIKDWQGFDTTHTTTVIVEFQIGDTLPMDLKLTGNTVETEFGELNVLVKRRFFLKFAQGLVYYSKDGSVWVLSKDAFSFKLKAGMVDDRLNLAVESNVK